METTNTETSPASAVIASIESAALPTSFVPEKIRSLGQKERTAKIRQALKLAGVKMGAVGKGVSVTSSTGSMCYWTNVDFERPEHMGVTDWGTHQRMYCETCKTEIAASRKLNELVLAAFPDLDNRSDAMSDHFDFVFSVSAR